MLHKHFYLNCIVCLIIFAGTSPMVSGMESGKINRIAVPMEFIETLEKCDSSLDRDILDLVEIDKNTSTLYFRATDQGIALLDYLGIPNELANKNSEHRTDRIDPQYMDYNDVRSTLSNYQSNYGSIMQRIELGVTAEGRSIWAAKISDNVTLDEAEPAIFFSGLHQAREVMSTEVAMDIVDYLCTEYSTNTTVQNWVNTCEIWIVPMVNPDGSNYCWVTDEYWIKNRCNLGSDIYGVDIGHNYETDWGSCFGSSSDPNSNSYRGSTPNSELETQAIVSLAEAQRPVMAMSFHSFNEYLLLPYGCYGEFVPESSILTPLASQIASEIRKDNGQYGYDFGHWWELLYANDGNEIDYLYAKIGTIPFAVEVNASSYYPPYSMRNTTVTRQRPGWQEALNIMVEGNMLKGIITDACTGEPIEASFWWAEYPPTSKETPRHSVASTGFYAIMGVTGSNTLVIDTPGYQPTTISVNMTGQPNTMNVELLPLSEPGLMIWGTYAHDSSGDNDGQLDPGETVELDVGIIAPGPGVTSISGVISTTDTYLSIINADASWPNLGPGESAWASDRFEVHASPGTPEGHIATFTVTFTTTETLCDNTSNYNVSIQTFIYLCPFWVEPMNNDPGWAISSYPTSGSPPGPYSNWEFGQPLTGPTTAYSGTNLYGTNLAGNYDNNWTLALTSTTIDCSDLTNVKLRYAHWVGLEDGYDHARIRLRNNGGSWTTFWDTTTSNRYWQISELDVSSVADNSSNVDIRFDIRADESTNSEGFYLDDVMFCGNYNGFIPPPSTPTVRPSATPTNTPSATSPAPTYTPTPPPNTHTPTPTPTTQAGTPTNTPITPTHTPSPPPPTNTPTQTPTNTMGPPTNTPTQTPGTPTATPTPVEDTPTSTPTSGGDAFVMDLRLNQELFNEGDLFLLELDVSRTGNTVTVDQYLILDVYGLFFYGPAWQNTLDFETKTYYDGYSGTTEIFRFTWPSVDGHATGLFFYAGCLYTGTADLIGNVDIVSFGY